MGLLTRREDLELAHFAQHWRTVHRELSLRLIAPGIMYGYVQNHRIPEAPPIPGLPLAGDGFPELWTMGDDLLARLGGTPEYLEGAYLDEPNFMNGRAEAILAREVMIDDGPGRIAAAFLVKAMLFFRRLPGVSREDFARSLTETPTPLLMPDAVPERLLRHMCIELPGDPGTSYDGVQNYDGQEASYWPDVPSFLRAWKTREEMPDFIDGASMVGVFVQEEPVLFPTYPDKWIS
jgi:hypothetical protein